VLSFKSTHKFSAIEKTGNCDYTVTFILTLGCLKPQEIHDMASSVYEPSPRVYHSSVQVQDNAYFWGGLTQDSSKSEVINIFDSHTEMWKGQSTTGVPPPGQYNGCLTVVGSNLYYFGGHDRRKYFSSVHELQLSNLEWNEINTAEGPLPKCGCGMVAYQHQLALIGGYGSAPTGALQPDAEFIKNIHYPGKGWTNELHLLTIKEGV